MSPAPFRAVSQASKTPGLQYVVVDADSTRVEHYEGWADVSSRRPMGGSTRMMAYSMSKTITAVAVLQLIESKHIGLDDALDRFCEFQPYGPQVTIRRLLCHTTGIPNPIPLKWVHPIACHDSFDEHAALRSVLGDHPALAFRPGTRFAYSNIGYWLLGAVVEQASGVRFENYVSKCVLERLSISPREMSYAVTGPENQAIGYLRRWSLLNLVKPLLLDPELIGDRAGPWQEIRGHYVNGAAFGGLVGSALGFARFLQDQLCERSLLLGDATRKLLYEQQRLSNNEPVRMTLGWHIGNLRGTRFFYKEGGGGGFHSMMRLYPAVGVGTVVMANAAGFPARDYLDANDPQFLR